MNTLLFLSLLIAGAIALPLQSYTVTGSSFSWDYKKLVLDTPNSRYYEQSYYNVQGSWQKVEYLVYPTITYRQITQHNNYCQCSYEPVGYSALTATWDNLALQTDYGTYSKYVGMYREFPGCSSFGLGTYTWYVNDAGSYPLNITRPSNWGTIVELDTSSYSATPDTSVFTTSCCSNPIRIC